MIIWIKSNLIWTEGQKIFLILLFLMVFGWFIWQLLFLVSTIFLVCCFYFFRNPSRNCPAAHSDDTILICPADGRVIDIQYDPHSELEGYAYKVSIFLSVFDVHVNWIPMAGTVKKIVYKPGMFMLAFLPKSSLLNECNDVVIVGKQERTILVRQIAGWIARRICCWIKESEDLTVNQKYGMIRFGSRVDTFLPNNVMLAVKKGEYVYGGQTVLGRWICY